MSSAVEDQRRLANLRLCCWVYVFYLGALLVAAVLGATVNGTRLQFGAVFPLGACILGVFGAMHLRRWGFAITACLSMLSSFGFPFGTILAWATLRALRQNYYQLRRAPRIVLPRCPHCGEPLSSDAAKQCLNCHADWH
jgi:hypothetical protein